MKIDLKALAHEFEVMGQQPVARSLIALDALLEGTNVNLIREAGELWARSGGEALAMSRQLPDPHHPGLGSDWGGGYAAKHAAACRAAMAAIIDRLDELQGIAKTSKNHP